MKVFACVLLISFAFYSAEAIVGGKDATSAQFPSTVAIHANSPSFTHFCGGALLTNQWIVTAAQCLDGATSFIILMGSTKLEGQDVNRVQIATSVKYIHPDYDYRTLDHDIGLLKMHMPVMFTDYIQPAYLPTVGLVDDMGVLAVGWGAINDVNPGPVNHLQFVDVTTISNTECQLTYGAQVKDSMVCINGNFNEGTCTDDSGSPLYISLNHHNWVVGVNSFSSMNGCEATDPSGYARVWDHLAWINETMSTK